MSWLRDHFYHFVFPALKCAKVYPNARSDAIKEFAPLDIKVPDNFPWRNVGYRMGKQKMPSEIRKLAYFCTKNNILFRDREILHNRRSRLNFDILKNTLVAAESLKKRLGCTKLLFAGRDVWLLEIMAKRAGIDSIYVPEISRKVVKSYGYFGNTNTDGALKAFLEEHEITGDELMVDTGFVGSIAYGLSRVLKKDIKFALMSQEKKYYDASKSKYHCQQELLNTNEDPNTKPNQIFPNRRRARAEALETEYLPKYFKSGSIFDFKVSQYLESAENIVLSACLTSDVWRGKKDSPFAEPIMKEEKGEKIKVLPYPKDTLFSMLQEQIAQQIDKEILNELDFQVKKLQQKADSVKPQPAPKYPAQPYTAKYSNWGPIYSTSTATTTNTITITNADTLTNGWYKYTI